MMPQTVDAIFASAAAESPDSVHLVLADGSTSSYAETFARADRLAALMVESGIEPGDRVACFVGNSRPLYEFFIAAGLAGAVAVPVNTLNTARENGILFDDCRPRGIVAAARHLAVLPDDILGEMAICLLAEGEGGAPWRDYEAALAAVAGPLAEVRSTPDSPALIIYSSGTTGRPKGIVLGHRQLLANARLTMNVLGYGPDDRFLTLLPSFHLFGFSFDFLYSGLVRGRLVALPSFTAEQALEFIERHRITVMAGVPTMFVTMFEASMRAGRDISSLRLIDVGGGPVPTTLIRELKGLGIDTVESYGLTEITTVASVSLPGVMAPEGSCGPVLEGIEVRVCDDQDQPVAPGQPGELQFRYEGFMLEYWQQPELTAATLKDGWLRTGDVGRLDEDGNLYILDRIKDMIVTNGYNVFPKEVELVLHEHPGVQQAAVVGLPHEVRGEDVHAFVVRRPESQVAADEILDWCNQNLARFKVPRGIDFVSEMPLTASGKIRRFVLRDQVRGRSG
jgi:long-chain acyl-CoA synthetase